MAFRVDAFGSTTQQAQGGRILARHAWRARDEIKVARNELGDRSTNTQGQLGHARSLRLKICATPLAGVQDSCTLRAMQHTSVEASYTEARKNLARLLDRVTEDREVVYIRRRGRERVALVAAGELSSLMETAHLLRSPKNAVRLLSALQRASGRAEAVERPAPRAGA